MRGVWISLTVMGLVFAHALWWRDAARRRRLQCPVWLGWLLENPCTNALAGSATLLQRAGVGPGMRILDAGCGTGRVTIPAAERVGPAGEVVTYGGQFENQQRAMARLRIVVPVSIALITLLLHASLRSWPLAFLVLTNLPFAAVGGVVTLWLRGLNLGVSAAVGFIALFGVAVLNGLVLLTTVERLREDGMAAVDAAIEGARQRLRPVLMTALVASIGFIPVALSQGVGAEVQRPLATVVIGGLFTSTLLTLFVVPTLYARFWRAEDEPEDARA